MFIFNNLLVLPAALYAEAAGNNFVAHNAYEIDELPTSLTLIVTIPFCMLLEDAAFTFGHWVLHRKSIYPYAHKMHHILITPIGFCSEFIHPIEYFFANVIPTGLGPFILGKNMHCFTILVWAVIRTAETLDAHSGYEFSWSPYRLIPFSGSADYHDFHHTHNVGNFSSFFSLWDTVFNLNRDFYEHQEEMKARRLRKEIEIKAFSDKLATELEDCKQKKTEESRV